MYERLALWMRYFFALLAVLFVVRAWVITVRDNRRARVLRAWLPETGTIGEWLVLGAPGGQERKNARYPILNEGTIGSSRRCDVRLVYPDVLREHAYFAATETGLRVRPVGEAPLCVESQVGGVYHPADGYVDMADGDVLVLGGLRMMLTLFDAPRPAREAPPPSPQRARTRRAPAEEEELFAGEEDYGAGSDPFLEGGNGEEWDDDLEDDLDAPFPQKARDTEKLWPNDANQTRKR